MFIYKHLGKSFHIARDSAKTEFYILHKQKQRKTKLVSTKTRLAAMTTKRWPSSTSYHRQLILPLKDGPEVIENQSRSQEETRSEYHYSNLQNGSASDASRKTDTRWPPLSHDERSSAGSDDDDCIHTLTTWHAHSSIRADEHTESETEIMHLRSSEPLHSAENWGEPLFGIWYSVRVLATMPAHYQ